MISPAAGCAAGDHPFYRWMRAGFEVFRLVSAGYSLYRGGAVAGTAAEVFPHASACLLAGALRARETPKDTFRRSVLRAAGVPLGAMQSAGLEIRDLESLREHYPLTLRRWVANLAAHRDEAIAAAGPQRERVWRLYMLGSALSFEAGELSVHQALAARPGAAHRLPLTRAQALS